MNKRIIITTAFALIMLFLVTAFFTPMRGMLQSMHATTISRSKISRAKKSETDAQDYSTADYSHFLKDATGKDFNADNLIDDDFVGGSEVCFDAGFKNQKAAAVSADKPAVALSFSAKSALLMDYNSGTILFEQNAKDRLPIASMVKIMVLNIIFDELYKGTFALDDLIPISENAASMGGSQAFLDANTKHKATDLIKSIIVASANDSCVAMAEFLVGDVDSFVVRMNNRAIEMGLKDTVFANCTGLPSPGQTQHSTAADVAVMFRNLIEHKEFFDYSKVWMYNYEHPGGRLTEMTNTNKLIRFFNGCDGGKTGFTNDAMSCLSATAKRGDTRLISVVMGAASSKVRNGEISRLLNYGFANFETRPLVFGGIKLEQQAKVSGGKQNLVDVAAKEDYHYLIKRGEKPQYSIQAQINDIKAPVKKGDIVGSLTVSVGDKITKEIDLIAMSDITKASYLDMLDKVIEKW